MLQECFPFIKYVYVGILFVFVFILLFNQNLQMVGFGSNCGLTAILTLLVCFDLFMDTDRNVKALVIAIPASTYTKEYNVYFPLWWSLLSAVLLQFTSSIMMVLNYQFLEKQGDPVIISRTNERKINNYKILTVVSITIVMILLFVYFVQMKGTDGSLGFSPGYQLFLYLLCILTFILPFINLYYANDLSKLRYQSTSG